MLKPILVALVLTVGMTGCVTYGNQRFVPTPEQTAAMEADSRRVQDTERAERAERRAERRQDMMDEADAIKRAYGDSKVYILH